MAEFANALVFCCSCMVAFVYFIWGKTIFGLFSQDAEILGYSSFIMDMVSLIVFLQIAQVIFSGCLRGSGDTKYVAMVSPYQCSLYPSRLWMAFYLWIKHWLMGCMDWIGLRPICAVDAQLPTVPQWQMDEY